MFHAKRLLACATVLVALSSVADAEAGPPSPAAPMPSFDWFDLSQVGPLPGIAVPDIGCVVVAYVGGHDVKNPWLLRTSPLCKDGAAPSGPVMPWLKWLVFLNLTLKLLRSWARL